METNETLRTLAAHYRMQVYELAAFLDLGTDYDETAPLTAAFVKHARGAFAHVHNSLTHNKSRSHKVTVYGASSQAGLSTIARH